jgi:putative ABC transport system permease protein
VLVVGSVLMTLTLSRLLHQNPGFRTDQLISFDLPQPPADPSGNPAGFMAKQAGHIKEIVEKVRQMPGVADVTVSDHGVLKGMMMMMGGLDVDGAIPPSSKETRTASARYVYPGYFRMLGIPLVRGREFTEHDSGDAQSTVLVNEAMAREYWGTLDVLGKRISTTSDDKRPGAK